MVMAGILSDSSAPADTFDGAHGALPPPRTSPLFRCGHCLAVIPRAALDPSLRCPACHKRNALPPGVRTTCERCGREQRIRVRQLGSEPRCTGCGQILWVDDVVLTPLHRRRRHEHATTSGHAGRYRHREGGRGQGILTLLILAIAALLSLKLITRL